MTSHSLLQLDERIRRFIWRENWTEIREVQELAIPLIVDGNRDVIVAAATASGKTEAAFLPALSHVLKRPGKPGLIVYISPLKALINDQFGRLQKLCEHLEVPVWPWHGDVSTSQRRRFLDDPHGVLLITPESIEALLCTRGAAAVAIFEGLTFVVVDELHAFIGTERGKQLQSLLHRVELAIARAVPRIGLSATLGDMRMAATFLRPFDSERVAVVVARTGGARLRVVVKGYEEPARSIGKPSATDDPAEATDGACVVPGLVAEDLFRSLRGTNNLVFPNSRQGVERYTQLLNRLCARQQIPNQFWPHHGSLAKEIRAETESALKRTGQPATAVCTSTLELGIDIGPVRSVAQIGPPPSVASLRQRLGRSGRRAGEPAILRTYCIEDAPGGRRSLADELRLATVQATAMIALLVEGWFEPPQASGMHLSTLVQQLLSLIAQHGGLTPSRAYSLVLGAGAPFHGVTVDDFKTLLRTLAEKELLMQDSSGTLLHGPVGEKLVNKHAFYAAFSSDDEFRVVTGAKTLGTLPARHLMRRGQNILFAGKAWRIDDVNDHDRVVRVSATHGAAPAMFSEGTGRVHTRVRQRMRELLAGTFPVVFLDETAARFLDEGRRAYARMSLDQTAIVDAGPCVSLVTWLGDAGNEAIACLFVAAGHKAWAAGPAVEVLRSSLGRRTIEDALDAVADIDIVSPDTMLAGAGNLEREKWDWALPDELLRKSFASTNLDFSEALAWIRALARSESASAETVAPRHE